MSAFQFFVDRDGHVCGGYADTHSRSDETWRLTACPVRSLEETGVTLQWPDGEPWSHEHIAGSFPTPTPEVTP